MLKEQGGELAKDFGCSFPSVAVSNIILGLLREYLWKPTLFDSYLNIYKSDVGNLGNGTMFASLRADVIFPLVTF